MIVDTSAIVAILFDEPERKIFLNVLQRAAVSAIAAPTLLECSMVLSRTLDDGVLADFDAFVADIGIEIVAFTGTEAVIAREAFLRYGKGRHPAGLNFGDCIAYAAAKARKMPLLYKGTDFGLTDVISATRP